MKLPCEIVQDLLFLYTDEACSPESRKAVEEHLSKCETCRKRLEAINLPETMAAEAPGPEPEQQEKVMKNSFRKIRRRWAASVLAVLMLLPIALLTVMGVHQYQGSGFAFTNLDDIYLSRKFMRLLEAEKFEEAAEMMDFSENYQEILDTLALTVEDRVSLEAWDICTIDGERYAVSVHPDGIYGYDWEESYDGEEAIFLWALLVTDPYLGDIFIPEAYWDAVVRFIEETYLYEDRIDWPQSYTLVETQWGNYYMPDELAIRFLQDEIETAYELSCHLWYIMPYEVYTEAKLQEEELAQQSHQEFQEDYGPVADMTLEEYNAYMRTAVVRRLEECKEMGISISGASYSGASWYGHGWNIYMNAEENFSDGKSYPVICYCSIQNGKVVWFHAHYPNKMTDADGLETEEGLIADPIEYALRMMYPYAELGMEGIIQGSENAIDYLLP